MSTLQRYELAPERRQADRRAGAADGHGGRRGGDRRRTDPAADPRIRRIFPLAESPEAAGLTGRERHQRRCLVVADGLATAAAFGVTAALTDVPLKWWALAAGVVAAVLLAKLLGLQDRDHLALRRSTLDETPKLLQLAAIVALTLWFIDGALDRGAVAVLLVSLAIALPATRMGLRLLARRIDEPERCLFVGDATVMDHIRRKVDESRANARIAAALPLRAGDTGEALGGVEGLREMVQANRIERVVIAPVSTDAADTLELIRMAKQACTRVSLVPRLFEVVGSAVEFEDLDGMTLIGVRRFGLSRSARAMKRSFDIAGSALALLFLAPIFAAIVAAVRLDGKGPVFFRQTRVGRDGQHFEILKFRTMVPDAERLKEQLRERNETVGLFKIAEDPRVTRVGRFLRKTSLDELPQLVNVLRGDMSLVGPRPLVLDEDAQILGLDRARLHLTPGMTGPWQVLRSGRVPMMEMVGLDYLYVANWSLWNDLKLLLRTVPYMLTRGGL